MTIELTILQIILASTSLFVIGGFVGMLIMALCVVAQRADERIERRLYDKAHQDISEKIFP